MIRIRGTPLNPVLTRFVSYSGGTQSTTSSMDTFLPCAQWLTVPIPRRPFARSSVTPVMPDVQRMRRAGEVVHSQRISRGTAAGMVITASASSSVTFVRTRRCSASQAAPRSVTQPAISPTDSKVSRYARIPAVVGSASPIAPTSASV